MTSPSTLAVTSTSSLVNRPRLQGRLLGLQKGRALNAIVNDEAHERPRPSTGGSSQPKGKEKRKMSSGLPTEQGSADLKFTQDKLLEHTMRYGGNIGGFGKTLGKFQSISGKENAATQIKKELGLASDDEAQRIVKTLQDDKQVGALRVVSYSKAPKFMEAAKIISDTLSQNPSTAGSTFWQSERKIASSSASQVASPSSSSSPISFLSPETNQQFLAQGSSDTIASPPSRPLTPRSRSLSISSNKSAPKPQASSASLTSVGSLPPNDIGAVSSEILSWVDEGKRDIQSLAEKGKRSNLQYKTVRPGTWPSSKAQNSLNLPKSPLPSTASTPKLFGSANRLARSAAPSRSSSSSASSQPSPRQPTFYVLSDAEKTRIGKVKGDLLSWADKQKPKIPSKKLLDKLQAARTKYSKEALSPLDNDVPQEFKSEFVGLNDDSVALLFGIVTDEVKYEALEKALKL